MDKLDMRYALPKLLMSRFQNLVNDLGGADTLSYQQRLLCERIIHLEWQVGEWETQARAGQAIDQARYQNAVNVLNGLVRSIGLDRQQRVITLRDLIDEHDKVKGDSTK